MGEGRLGYVRVRLKKHRWYSHVLKSRDPLVLSVGWRRFQSLPVYSTEDHNGRQRMIKYTPQHMHCTATLYGRGHLMYCCSLNCWVDMTTSFSPIGPVASPGTGVLAVQSVSTIPVRSASSAHMTSISSALLLLLPPPSIYRPTFASQLQVWYWMLIGHQLL